MLQSLHAITAHEALLILLIVLLTLVVPILTYSNYHKKRHVEGARLAILLIGGGGEANLLALAFLQIYSLRWWPAFNGFVIGSEDFALILIMGLAGTGLILHTVGCSLMPDGLRDRVRGDTRNTPG